MDLNQRKAVKMNDYLPIIFIKDHKIAVCKRGVMEMFKMSFLHPFSIFW